jgi:nitrate reductase assembly molybdenum cofactor insertion protein NarJ
VTLGHPSPSLPDRLVWQCASLLLAYPDAQRADRLDTVDELLAHLSGPAAALLARAATALRTLDPDACRCQLLRHLRSAPPLHHVPDVLDGL